MKGILEKIVRKKVESAVKKELGNKSLAYTSRFIRGLIPAAGVDAIRKRVISGIEGDLKRAIKKNKQATIDDLLKDALNTPDYMALLKDLDMSEEHLRLLAQEALKERRSNEP